MSSRQDYYSAAKKELESNIFNHSLAVEACMAGLYDYFKANSLLSDTELPKEDWIIAGLIHDIDYSNEFKADHPHKTKEALAKYNLDLSESIDLIVKAHGPELTGVKPKSLAQWSIFCADSLTGLIIATTLVYPNKKLEDVKTSSVLKRFLKEPKFAAGTRRDEVIQCENPNGLNLKIDQFIEICLNSIKKIAPEIGL
jgi:predicted hydrolase (HD superfamily)